MMMSLFMSFDPSMFINMLIVMIMLMLTTFKQKLILNWFGGNNCYTQKEVNTTMKSNLNLVNSLITNLMIVILVMNITGVLPYTFTLTAQMATALMVALPMWMMSVMASIMFNTNSFISHLVPQGSPLVLSQFMVIIESVSLMIRPITLSVRLMANMTAGHILLILCSTPFILFGYFSIPLIILVVLETAVAIVQMYVMTTLIMMYASEIN